LTLAAEMLGDDAARKIQLGIEYDPAPPFAAGSPASADPTLVESVRQASHARQSERLADVKRAAAKLA
jgi:cyclohexyl-isocyanide hydratase